MSSDHHPSAPSEGRQRSRREVVGTLAAGALGMAIGRGPGSGSGQDSEILIRNGRVVNAAGVAAADVRIRGERITEVGSGLRPGRGARTIDAGGLLVMPGGIDPHTHLQPPFADDFTTGSRAALAGGITAVGTFAFPRAGQSLVEGALRLTNLADTTAIADMFLHGAAWPIGPEVITDLEDLSEAGQPSFKVFMPQADFPAQLPEVIKLLEAARSAGMTVMIHCEDAPLLSAAARRLADEGRTSLANYGASRPILAEVAATEQAVALCESTGATIYVVHLSSERALAVCRRARAAGLPVLVETRPLYLHLNESRLTGPDLPLYIGQPPLRTPADSEALWNGLADGSIDVLATDHAPWTRAQKLDPALTITNLRPGVSDLQFMLPLYFSEGVRKRGLSLERFVATTSTNAATIFGLAPDRGAVREGALADLAVWDPEATRTIRADADYSRADYSVYEGWEVTGWPRFVIRRGSLVCQDGTVSAPPGSGRIIHRRRRPS